MQIQSYDTSQLAAQALTQKKPDVDPTTAQVADSSAQAGASAQETNVVTVTSSSSIEYSIRMKMEASGQHEHLIVVRRDGQIELLDTIDLGFPLGLESEITRFVGETSIDSERLRWAAREVHALEFIDQLPKSFEAPVRERGAVLSVGQKQLIAFARALAFDPRILIVDEATSSVDTETEQKIQRALERLLEGRTSLVIAHRLSTILAADVILVMNDGKLAEQARRTDSRSAHEELLAEGGLYADLYQTQFRHTPDPVPESY